ncbi:MAG: SUMF1/EgtB/PvdO family nonheme iron enzyme [Candidatus Sedimenticola sp. 20ELBAFRAG]
MSTHNLLGRLSGIHRMMTELLENTQEQDCYRTFHPSLAPLAWYFGRAIYLETYWLREVVQGDDDMTSRVREIFARGALPPREQWQRLPPKDHLLNWALELQDENLMRLANPTLLPDHPMCEDNRLIYRILQEHALSYENILMVLTERRLLGEEPYQVKAPFMAAAPEVNTGGLSQGHYRIGAKNDMAAFDNELPTQMVELSNYRIDKQPASNANFLRFMEAGGYTDDQLWTEAGRAWRRNNSQHPHHWRQDHQGNWYSVTINGPFDLISADPVMGISQHEATAYANWVATLGGDFDGAVLQHEYQWETAKRFDVIEGDGRVWEWCSNSFHPYDEYQPSEYSEGRTSDFDQDLLSLRGACLHTQPALRRISYRNRADAGANWLFAGVRLVYPHN